MLMNKIINNYQDASELQYDLNSLMKWANEWQLNINFDKYRTIHFGHNTLLCINHLNDIFTEN